VKLFNRRKAEPEKHFWAFAKDPPLPECPLHGDRCGQTLLDGVGWVRDYRPCEALEGAIRRAEWNQTHEAVFNPLTNDFDIYPR